LPNLLGSTFYGPHALVAGSNRATLAGIALHIVLTGSVGAAFGVFAPERLPRRRLVLLGILAGVVWSFLSNTLLWQLLNPLLPGYMPHPATTASYALFGACLGCIGRSHPRIEPVQVIDYPPDEPLLPQVAEIPRRDELE